MAQVPYIPTLFMWLKGLALVASVLSIFAVVSVIVFIISAAFFDEEDDL